MQKSMTMVSSIWNDAKTFKLIPTTGDCPYVECIYDANLGVLAVVSKNRKQSYHMLPRLDDNGDVQRMKVSKRNNGKDYKEERRLLESFQEYYIIEEEEIVEFIEKFSDNFSTYDYKQYFKKEAGADTDLDKSKIIIPDGQLK
jgi:hypothetical protein